MQFDPNADPEQIAARAAELALEQLDRFRHTKKRSSGPDPDNTVAIAFYSNPFEILQSNTIARLMSAYAVLKGYVPLEDTGLTPKQ